MYSMLKKIALASIFSVVVMSLCFCSVKPIFAQSELVPDTVTYALAKVVDIVDEGNTTLPGTDVPTTMQTIKALVLNGDEEGETVTVENDYLNLEVGETFYLTHTIGAFDGVDYYAVSDPYRIPQLAVLALLFVVVVLVFGGIQGVRGLVSLIGSFLLIFYVLLPGILSGYSPLLVTIGVSSLIIVLGAYVTHGFTRTTSAAVIGMVATVLITGIMAYVSVRYTRLTGFGSEEAVYLNLNSNGSIDILGLLLGSIIIGLLGVLYDAAIGQSVSVDELMRISPETPKRIIYQRAIRIGREHIGALVNTLAIAYVGASLPLLLLFTQSTSAGVLKITNMEIFATEIVRIMIGSIGLVLAVPVTTLVSVWMLGKGPRSGKGHSHRGHSHTHTH
jgi:uncharacterized membrane protein